jgi:hypothetical protein
MNEDQIAAYNDNTSVKGEYLRLYATTLLDFASDIAKRITDSSNSKTVVDLVIEYTGKLDDISNADFQDNFNPHHREEQPF